jgi:uncharacterized membrane protein YczE
MGSGRARPPVASIFVLVSPSRESAGRAARLVAGCVLLGPAVALMVAADLGLAPWDILHQGVANHTGIAMGTVGIVVGALLLAAWVPVRQRLGVGTFVNVVVVGLSINLALSAVPTPANLAARWAFLLAGIVVFGFGTGLYISARLGPGPRDGLMTGLQHRTGRSIRLVRTAIEVAVLVAGVALGGTVGVGTVLFAVAVGPIVQLTLGWLSRAAARTAVPVPARMAVAPPPAP